MSVLKVKENGAWKDIPAIKGETGDAAGFGTATASVDTGTGTPSCVVTLSGEDTAKNFDFAFHNLMYDDSDLQSDFADLADDFDVLQGQFDTAVAAVTTDTEVTDIRVGADGVTDTTAGASVRRQFTDVKSAFNDLVYGDTHTYTVSNTGTNKFDALLLKGVRYIFTNNTNAQCTLRVYNSDGTNALITSALTAGSSITFMPSTNNAIQIGGWMSGTGEVSLATDFSAITDKRLLGIYDYSYLNSWEIGSIYGENGVDYDSVTRGIRTPNNAKIYIHNNTVALSVNPLIETVYAFKYDSSNAYIGRLGVSGARSVHLDSGYYYRFLALAKTGTVITADTISTYSDNFWACGETLADLLIANDDYSTNIKGYSVGADLVKRELIAERVGTGTLKYGQSFLIYNDKFYSTDGEHIAVQSADFTLEQDIAISVGHGNAFALGETNKGFISGWDDNKIYVVNLDNLTLYTTIELPTTGYTTCAIDDHNGIAYIFQRDTRPNTESKYNVIAYDYVNQNVLYTNETTKAFGAMQACDYYNDKIIVLNGLGTTALPNGYRVYNTKGEILADYVIPAFGGIEPEGVFINKETGDLYISNVDARVYRITSD